MTSILSLLLALQGPAVPDTYADPATAAFVARARAARERNERLVTSYTATVKQRIGVGIRALSRDRMAYRQELVARIHWRRDSVSSLEVVGAREGVPVAIRGDRLPEDLEEDSGYLVVNPAQDYLRLFGSESGGDGFVYPLHAGGEADYRYRAGDTTTITLPTGRQIRLAALHVTPRRAEWRLLQGTLWFDADTHGLVQFVARPARPYEFHRDADPDDRSGVPGFVNPRAEVRHITIEYGLYEGRWWMLRYLSVDAVGTMGSWLGMPVKIERVYEDYAVEGGTPPPEGSTFRPAGTVRRREAITDSVARRQAADSARAALEACVAERTSASDDRSGTRRARQRCRRMARYPNLEIVVPDDTLALLTSPELGPPILAMGDLISEAELGGLARAIGALPSYRWGPRLELPRGATALLQHARYNRIEALSLGLRGGVDLGPGAIQATGRIGLADLVPNGELSLSRATPGARIAVTAYRRLAAANPDTRPLGPVNSMLALLAQRDDGEYYRSLGVELVGQNANAGWWSARLYAERQRPARVETRASLPHLFNAERLFRPNIMADSADQIGGAVSLRGTRALSRSVTLGGEVTGDAAAGDFDFGRGALTVRLFVTPRGPLAAALTASAGTSTGMVPVQSRFYLGGAATLRGYPGGVAAGDAFWTGRVEVGNSFPAARLVGFGDIGWAGNRSEWRGGRPLVGAGVGASFLDGLVRVDLARGFRAPGGWRMEFYFDGVL